MAASAERRSKVLGVTAAAARRLALKLPGVEQGKSYGFPALLIGKKFFARLRDNNATLAVHLGSFTDRDYLLANHPNTFFTTAHYQNYPTVLVRLATVREDQLREILTDAWRRLAPRRFVAGTDAT
jgi:hypothetical protein